MNKRPEILVAGGGAAGMMAALFAARAGASVTLLERNEKLGKKIYITGKGRCNLTNDCSLEEFLRQVPRNPRFLYGALNRFGPQDMMALMEEAGCPVEVQRGQRVFPRSEKASDVIRALARLMEQKDGFGYDVCRDEFVDMLAYGISDPVKVTRLALECALSASATLLTTQSSVTAKK